MALFELSFTLPDWVCAYVGEGEVVCDSVEQRMEFVVGASRENVRRGTGGPFGAGVFDSAGRLLSLGVNIVEASNCSILHAEMVAIALAQKAAGRYDLSDGGREDYELIASTEPCAMCFGAVPWSGVSRLVCGARDEDARSIGFDEGPKLDNWVEALEQRGITVIRDVLRKEAAAVLQEYAQSGGKIYNAGQTDSSTDWRSTAT
ncbi:MAG: nucleoside deaminase [Planctomycetota bacterium]|jgi:tRNA(Arg) A34 adenosine deaminase TadA